MRVMIFGGTGSLGQALIKLLLSKGDTVISASRGEYRQFFLAQKYPNETKTDVSIPVNPLVITNCDITKPINLRYQVDRVINLAAMKHVGICEANPLSAFDVNVIGNQHVIDWCLKQRYCPKKIYVGTDKAINPINFYGYTKLIAERQWLNADYMGFEVVRFGNLFGSSGSIVEILLNNKTGIYDISHVDSERYFLSLSTAAQVIYDEMMGNVTWPKYKKIKIVDLVHIVNPHAEIRYVGLRPGEKLIEDFPGQENNGYYTTDEIKQMIEEVVSD